MDVNPIKQAAYGELQPATTIAKTTQTLIGKEINCDQASYLTLWIEYTKGDETGVLIKPYFLEVPGESYSVCDWAGSSGAYTPSVVSLTLTATAKRAMTFDVRGISGFRLEAAGSNNDGTPTGTLKVNYSWKG